MAGIYHIPPFHYVVIESATSQQVIIVDPASGQRHELSLAEFAQQWKGNCLVVIGSKTTSSASEEQSSDL